LTSGPQIDASKSINIGVAAHITAAAPGGPRYDARLSPSERKSIQNGIWLCQSCAKLIDSDPERYTLSLLEEWKQKAEAAALAEIESTGARSKNSIDDPLDVLFDLLSAPEDWIKVNGDEYIRHRYHSEFVIKRDLEIPEQEFDEPWVRKFPDKTAWKTYIEYWCGSTLLKRSIFVIVDGGRYLIPLPKLHNPLPDKDDWNSITFSIDRTSIEWKTAKLFEQYFPLEDVLPRVGVLLV